MIRVYLTKVKFFRTPYNFSEWNGNANVWIVNSTGQLTNNNVHNTNGVRPDSNVKK